MKLLFWLFLFTSLSANARVFTEDFNTTARKDSSTLVWNFELGYLHPNLQIFGYSNGTQPVASQTTFSVGDGSHGSFEISTYAQFGSVVGNHITIDANQFPILKVSRFNLDAAYTLSSINGPLIIYSLSTVDINGVIECFGGDGSPAVGAIGGAGGIARCAGFAGGNGGNAATSGTNGLSLAGTSIGGGGGHYTGHANGAGGGGGAGYVSNNGAVGANAVSGAVTNVGGSAGLQKSGLDHGFEILLGSGGGGGGSGSLTEGGGGGGAGGGTVVIHAVGDVNINLTGSILASGGNGGGANSGGGGGGGAGGNIQIFTAATFFTASGNVIVVNPGNGAIPTVPSAGDGGLASQGRTWDVGNFSGPVGESHGSTLASDGQVGFVSGTVETAVSKSFDTESTLATFESIIANPVSSDITFEIAGSDDDFTSDNTGWISSAAISVVAEKRYVKYRLSLNNSDALNPTLVDDIYINYDPGTKENFAFKSGGCGIVKNPPQNKQWLIFILLFIPLVSAWRLRKSKTVRVPAKK
ncbi:MAG: hypothetical protein V4654_14930 [Bdellovibrionota bacterium]